MNKEVARKVQDILDEAENQTHHLCGQWLEVEQKREIGKKIVELVKFIKSN